MEKGEEPCPERQWGQEEGSESEAARPQRPGAGEWEQGGWGEPNHGPALLAAPTCREVRKGAQAHSPAWGMPCPRCPSGWVQGFCLKSRTVSASARGQQDSPYPAVVRTKGDGRLCKAGRFIVSGGLSLTV